MLYCKRSKVEKVLETAKENDEYEHIKDMIVRSSIEIRDYYVSELISGLAFNFDDDELLIVQCMKQIVRAKYRLGYIKRLDGDLEWYKELQ